MCDGRVHLTPTLVIITVMDGYRLRPCVGLTAVLAILRMISMGRCTSVYVVSNERRFDMMDESHAHGRRYITVMFRGLSGLRSISYSSMLPVSRRRCALCPHVRAIRPFAGHRAGDPYFPQYPCTS